MILITRPKQDAIEFASDIQKLDLEFHTDSLTYIKYKKPKLSLDETRVILISSMNAVRSLLHLNTEQKKSLTFIRSIGKNYNVKLCCLWLRLKVYPVNRN